MSSVPPYIPAANGAVRTGPSGDGVFEGSIFEPSDTFERRHVGPSAADRAAMLRALGYGSMEALIADAVPSTIRLGRELDLGPGLPGAMTESGALARLRGYAAENRVLRSMIGMGYSDTITPSPILRNIMENPGWYTQYTPYQAEISQGRLEALLNFQTMVSDLTGLPVAGASLLDEATAAAEAMGMCAALAGDGGEGRNIFVVSDDCHPQTVSVVRTRAESMGLEVVVAGHEGLRTGAGVGAGVGGLGGAEAGKVCGVLVQYPSTDGRVEDYRGLAERVHAAGALLVCAADLLGLTVLTPPGEFGADIAVGSAQRFGVPMGFGGPHAAFIACREGHVRKMPGRIIGVSKDAHGNVAYRMAIQTREQHIRREKATSNICTAQALLAVMAGMYAVYHGPEGLTRIARRARAWAGLVARAASAAGHGVLTPVYFDTLRIRPGAGRTGPGVVKAAADRGINLRDFGDGTVGVSFDETTTAEDVRRLGEALGLSSGSVGVSGEDPGPALPGWAARGSTFLTHPVFHSYRSEHGLTRYIFMLQGRDLSLVHSMIPLGSCTMKLNATSEMIPVTWREFGGLHPFAPSDQTAGYRRMFADLERWLSEVTGFAAVSLQPNAGSQGEYAGLLVIRAYHRSRGEGHRDVCLIPTSAHGTNPASAVIAGMRVVAVACDARGNIDVGDLRAKAAAHGEKLAALMVTYPSTHGVFEETIREVCAVVHGHGGQVYMDGANMNAQVGLTSPGHIGADVCHLNLHKTFCIPHGGGGPGMGPIGVASHLAGFLPGHPVVSPVGPGASGAIGAVSAAPWGSPSILTISWMYIAMMGSGGLRRATEAAILNANYMMHRLSGHYPVLYVGSKGRCAHEFILDCRGFEKSAGVKVDDIAKRLMDYGFHAPTMSFPVPGTLMIEPTESEPREELDRFCDAMISIRGEIREVEEGRMGREDNPLKHAPHTLGAVTGDAWGHGYSRERAAWPAGWLRSSKFWPHVGRVDNAWGDRNLVCACVPMEAYAGGR
ncbi:MAG: aminomethyl-transferring glycine dehydrogenase [Phycisphaeraceae bacterium]|nr:MAG: aminomethyl-transferring glycine dehydrogenase [Phycisphaeraceae bacterium]